MNNIGSLQLTRGELAPSKAEFGANLQKSLSRDQGVGHNRHLERRFKRKASSLMWTARKWQALFTLPERVL
jgi:hypothetical protein